MSGIDSLGYRFSPMEVFQRQVDATDLAGWGIAVASLGGRHSSRSNDLSVHARIDSTRYVRLLWEEDDKNSHAAMFEMKIGNKPEKVIAGPRERTAASVFNDLESVALAIEGSDLSITEDNFVPTARCIQDTKERQLVTRSGLQSLQCCVCHLHHEPAMNAPASVRQFFKAVLQGRCQCWRCQGGSIQVPQKAGVPRSAQFFSCRYVKRNAT